MYYTYLLLLTWIIPTPRGPYFTGDMRMNELRHFGNINGDYHVPPRFLAGPLDTTLVPFPLQLKLSALDGKPEKSGYCRCSMRLKLS